MEFIEAHPNNFQRGRAGKPILYVIIHTIVGSVNSAVATFQNPNRIASAHYVIGVNRQVKMVREEDTAYHAGNFDINQKSIGIEHEDNARPYDPRPDALYEISANLVADICKRHAIPINRERIRMHREVSLRPTACPATLDIDRIVARAAQIAAPPPPKPEPEWKINLQTIGTHEKTFEKPVNLFNIETGAAVKIFPEGSTVQVHYKTFHAGQKYYMTAYSVSKGIPNGFLLEEFDWSKPVPPPVILPPIETPTHPKPVEPPKGGPKTSPNGSQRPTGAKKPDQLIFDHLIAFLAQFFKKLWPRIKP
ncbi:MAG: peptidoglycan recognition family protein [Candidatus Nitrosotenuis sp.]